MSKVINEFYCTKSGGGCGGYFLPKINTAINGKHIIVCPNCKHEHTRTIEKGHIVEQGRFVGSNAVDHIYSSKATFRMKPYTTVMESRAGGTQERDSVLIKNPLDVPQDISHWVEVFGDRV